MAKLFNSELKVINIGLRSFQDSVIKKNVPLIQVDWKPRIAVSENSKKIIQENLKKIEKANSKTIEKILRSKPVLIGLDIAKNIIPGMQKNLILHAGPPVKWENMCGPMKGAITGALIYEGLAGNPSESQVRISVIAGTHAPFRVRYLYP